jgi:hypothetical protein
VVTEGEVESFAAWEEGFREGMADPWVGEWFSRMVPLVDSGSLTEPAGSGIYEPDMATARPAKRSERLPNYGDIADLQKIDLPGGIGLH